MWRDHRLKSRKNEIFLFEAESEMSHSWAGIKQRNHQLVQVLPSLHLHSVYLALLSNLNLIVYNSLLPQLLAQTSPLLHTWYWAICWKDVDSPPTATSATVVEQYIQEREILQAGVHMHTIHSGLDGHRQYFSWCFVTEIKDRLVTDLKLCSHLPVHDNVPPKSPGALRKVNLSSASETGRHLSSTWVC